MSCRCSGLEGAGRAYPGRAVLAAVLGLALLAAGCGAGQRPAAEPSLPGQAGPGTAGVRIVATFYPYAELARMVAGARGQVFTLVPDGAELHDWEPRPSDAVRVREADLLIYNGAGLEPWLPRLLAGLPPQRPARLEAAAGLSLVPAPRARRAGAGDPDPHIWLDPVLLQDVVWRLRDALTRLDPAGARAYADAANEWAAALERVDREYRQTLSTCARRTLLVTHGFFTYPAARYGLEQLAITGVSPDAEPSPRTLARLAEVARERGIRVLFAETRVGRRVAEALAAEAGLEVRALHPMEGLTPEERARGTTLLDLFRRNLEELKAGLGCGAQEGSRGRAGRAGSEAARDHRASQAAQ